MENLTEVKMDLVKIDPKEFGIEESKANLILAQFEPLQERMKDLEPEYLEVINMPLTDVMAELKAAELLKKYVKIRTGRNAVHKAEKDFFLNAGRFVDRIRNDANVVTIEREDKLDSIKNHFVNLEAERVKALAASRIEMLKEFEFDGNAFNLGSMEDNTWISFLSVTRMGFEAKQAEAKRLELEAIEKENKAIRERAKIEAENKELKLKAELAEKEAKIKEEKENETANLRVDFLLENGYYIRSVGCFSKQATTTSIPFDVKFDNLKTLTDDEFTSRFNEVEHLISKDIEATKKLEAERALRKIEQDKSDALLEKQRKDAKDKADKLKAESDLKLKLEREANDKLKAELQAKADAERKAEEAKQAELKAKAIADAKALKAPEKEQLTKWVNSCTMIPMPVLKDVQLQAKGSEILLKFAAFKKWANEQIETI